MNEQDLSDEQADACEEQASKSASTESADVVAAEAAADATPTVSTEVDASTASTTPSEVAAPVNDVLPAVIEQDEAASQELKYLIEATLLAAGRPVTTQQLLDLFEERDRPGDEQLQAALAALAQDYATRGIELAQVASGWRIQVRARYVESVSRLWSERPSKYSRALLETLALVAYRQPITRSEIEEIRGVSISSTIMRTLQERNWIRVVGHREVPGRPELLGTTREFLDYFNLRSLDQLPTLAELKDLESIGVQLELPGNEVLANVAASEDVANIDSGNEETGTAEAPSAEAEVAASEASESASVDDASAAATESDSVDEPELSADAEADGDDTDDTDEESDDADAADEDDDTPTLVASADDERDSGRHVSEPPQEDR
jgi:segregation and condensation protein B